MTKDEIAIGTEFLTRGKSKKMCKVIDIYRTYNSLGELVRTTYLCEHEFCGQPVRHEEVATTVLMGAAA